MSLRRILPLSLAIGWVLLPATEAPAASCTYQGGNLGSWHEAGNWDCGHVPTSADEAVVPTLKNVAVSSDAVAGGVSLPSDFSQTAITFSNEATLATGTLNVETGTIQGAGTLTVAGAFTKDGDGGETMFILDSADVVLNGNGTLAGGAISICQAGDPPSDPTLHLNAELTIEDTVNTASVFNCSSSGARVRIGPDGHLIQAKSGQVASDTAIDNDGKITVQAGTFLLKGGTQNSLNSTSDGEYLADAGATLEFQGGSPPVIGASARLGGAGTIHINTLGVTTNAGATIDPATLQLTGELRLLGSGPATLSDLNLTGGTIDSDRPVTVAGDMDVTGGVLQGDFALTVQPGGSFTKAGAGTLFIRNTSGNAAADSADLVLNADASVTGGTFCVSWGGDPALGDPDRPGLFINQDFTIGSGAPAGAFQCGPQFGNSIHLGGPDGHLSKVGPGTTNFNDLEVAGGTLSVASGQTFVFQNTFAQSGGVTEIASGGVLQTSPTLSGGILRGAGQLTGNLTNTSGTVRPGSSPGTLTVTGNYTQGAGGVLGIDVDGTTQGTGYDHLSVSGAASLDGTVAVNKGPGFDPELSDTFQFLTSGSRSGSFDALVGSRLASGKSYVLDHPAGAPFGARLTVTATPGTVAGPTLTDTDPDSFADDNYPEIKGTAPPGSTIALYATADCSGPPAAVGSAADFASPGLTVQVDDDTTTTFRATASIGSDTSPCSSSIDYEEDSGPADVIVDASTTQAFLDSITRLRGSLIMDNVDSLPDLIVPNLTQLGEDLTVIENDGAGTISLGELGAVGGSVEVTGNTSAGVVSMGELGTVGGSVEISGNTSAGVLSLGELGAVAGDLTIEDNGDATVALGSLDQVSGDLSVESTGTAPLELGAGGATGDADVDATGHPAVSGATAGGSLDLTNSHTEATMTAEIPGGAFAQGVQFAITHLDPASLAPASGTGADGGATTIDPVTAWQFDFDVPTLNQDATLTFDVIVDGLDPASREDFLTALDSGAATLATRGDTPGGTYRAFPLCAAAEVPSADGCVTVEKLDQDGQPTGGTPSIVRFSGVVGHFSSWAVAIAEPGFSLGNAKLNKRKGTATLKVEVPGAGEVALRGKAVKGQRKTAAGPGDVKLKIKPKGKARKKLKRTGKATVEAKVTYTPVGSEPATKVKRIKLKRS